MTPTALPIPAEVLAAYAPDGQPLGALPIARLRGGLINDTFCVGDRYILQRLHPIFRPEVNTDIAALTPTLRAHGVPVPALLPTRDGRLWVEVPTPADSATSAAFTNPAPATWRLMTRLPGRTTHQVEGPAMARAAGDAAARFHAALLNTPHAFAFTRPGAHDTDAHMAKLSDALRAHPRHRLYDAVAPLAEDLLSSWSRWGALPALPARVIHGDLKVSNLLFNDSGDAVTGVIDLDTMARAPLDVELGDALRSWCASGPEHAPDLHLRLDIAEAALRGYRAAALPWLDSAEAASFPAAVERVSLTLAARFAADALHESYFGWDPAIAPTRGDHNLLRALGQRALARAAYRAAPTLRALITASP
jgi:Ser/Thr protein kinase RdoA (MazF antagonist)